MSEEKELFEWVEIPHEYATTKSPRWEYLPSSGSWVHTDKGYNWFYQGVFYTDTFYGTRVYPKEWLKPIQSSLKEENINYKELYEKINKEFIARTGDDETAYKIWQESSLTPKSIRDSEVRKLAEDYYGNDIHLYAKQRDGYVKGYTAALEASLKPKSIRDSEATLLEEIRQIKAVIIHFATLDKMPTLGLLDRERLIEHVVTIGKNILEKYPPKKQL